MGGLREVVAATRRLKKKVPVLVVIFDLAGVFLHFLSRLAASRAFLWLILRAGGRGHSTFPFILHFKTGALFFSVRVAASLLPPHHHPCSLSLPLFSKKTRKRWKEKNSPLFLYSFPVARGPLRFKKTHWPRASLRAPSLLLFPFDPADLIATRGKRKTKPNKHTSRQTLMRGKRFSAAL